MPDTVTDTKHRVNDADRHVAVRIRQRRKELRLSQQMLANLIGVSYQQLCKYEKGINRVAVGRLLIIAHALGVEVSYFYEGLPKGGLTGDQQQLKRLLADFTEIPSPQHRRALVRFCSQLAETRE